MACNARCAYDWYSLSGKCNFCIRTFYCAFLHRLSRWYNWLSCNFNAGLYLKYRGVFSYCHVWFINWNRLYI